MRMSLNLDPAFLLSSRAYGLKGKAPFGSKELSRAYGLKGKNATLGQKSGLYGLQDTK